MRKLPYLLLPILLAVPAQAAPPPDVTVTQLDQMLAGLRQQSDAKAARHIAAFRLTERANSIWLARWEAEFQGDRARAALMAVVDASAFLQSPAAEIPAIPPPDAAAQQQILARIQDYVKQTLPRMPNFLALRTTTSFVVGTEDRVNGAQTTSGLLEKQHGQRLVYKVLGPATPGNSAQPELFWFGSFAQQVAYRGGVEVADSSAAGSGYPGPSSLLLSTNGEFGSVLSLLLIDVSPVDMVWDHWEQVAEGPLAVFRYSVPAERSHFAVDFTNGQPEYPAYHGQVALDAADGSIRRITLLTTGSEVGFIHESSILVEFAPAEIGPASYVCPARGVAMMRYFDTFEHANTLHTPIPYQTSINDVSFTKYHLFRSESHIVPGASTP
jgi:hypothetical protein